MDLGGLIMWLSGQHKRPNRCGEGQTGIVTVGGGETAVLLDSERRGLEVYAPAGYDWTPEVDQRVLVIQGQGEIPCIVGVRQDGARPQSVDIGAKAMSVSGQDVSVRAGGTVDLRGKVLVNGTLLEDVIAQVAARVLGGTGT